MRLSLSKFSVLLAVPAALLTGCGSSSPDEKVFLANAAKQMESREKTVCLQLPGQGDYASFIGGLPRGWVAVADAPAPTDSYASYTRRAMRPKLDALVEVGVLRKEPYELFVAGVAQPATRYLLSEEGRKAVTSSDYGSCLQVGQWAAAKVVLPRSGVKSDETPQLIRKKEEGGNVSYEAWVSYELQEKPSWASSPALVAAYPEQLSQVSAGKVAKVELVQFNKEWVSKQVLSRRMAKEAVQAPDSPERASAAVAAEIPSELHETALARLNAQAPRFYTARTAFGLQLPITSASETPRDFVRQRPGTVFLAKTADPQFQARSMTAQRLQALAEREKMVATLPAEQRAAQLELLTRERAAIAAASTQGAQVSPAVTREAVTQTDRYLNARKELVAVLDALVEAGAYERKDVKKEDVTGAEQEGVLYSPLAGTEVQDGAITLGVPRYTKIVKQTVAGPVVQVSVAYELDSRPKWLDAAAAKVPGMMPVVNGTRMVVARPVTNPEFPYSLSAHPY